MWLALRGNARTAEIGGRTVFFLGHKQSRIFFLMPSPNKVERCWLATAGSLE